MVQLFDALGGDLLQARAEIVDELMRSLTIPAEERADLYHFIESVEAMMRDVGCEPQDMARVCMLHVWG